jgi:lipopolysaccharide biosynthesis glycosyltransferase
MNLVVTMSIGWWADEIIKISYPFLEGYAKKINAEFKVIDKKRINLEPTYMEKFQVYDIFDQYDRILWLDCDILIHPDCPNVFELVPNDYLGAIPDCESGEWWNVNYFKDIKMIQNALGWIGWETGYFNIGVLVMSKIHKELFANPENALKMRDRYHDQLLVNYNFQKMYLKKRSKFFCMDTKFNAMVINGNNVKKLGKESRLDAHILHFAGIKRRPKLMEWFYKRVLSGEIQWEL